MPQLEAKKRTISMFKKNRNNQRITMNIKTQQEKKSLKKERNVHIKKM